MHYYNCETRQLLLTMLTGDINQLTWLIKTEHFIQKSTGVSSIYRPFYFIAT